MAISERARLIQRIRRACEPKHRLSHLWARLRVWRRNDEDTQAEPAELLERLYGGTYDRLAGEYVDSARGHGDDYDPGVEVVELSCHPGQLPLVLYEPNGKMRVLCLAGPGSGKTRGLAVWAVLRAIERPNATGLIVGATSDRLKVVWDALLDVLEGTGWIEDRQDLRHIIRLTNGSQFVGKTAKEPSRAIGTGIQGISADFAAVDESQNVGERAQRDIDERGRRVEQGKYLVMESATLVDGNAWFLRRLADYKKNPRRDVIRLNPLDNAFVDKEYWDRLREDYSERDFRQRILSEEMPPEKIVYCAYSHEENVRPRPKASNPDYEDITGQLTRRYGSSYRFICGHDFGVLTSASEFLKAYRHRPSGKIHWWVVDEITSGSHTGSEGHARKLIGAYPVDEFFCIADPAMNTRSTDTSDYAIFRSLGISIERASAKTIMVKARTAMLNGLLCNSVGERRLFIDCDSAGRPRAPRLVESFLSMEYDDWGNPENVRKNAGDPTHWPSAVSFGLWPFEQIAPTRQIYALKTRPFEDDERAAH